MDTFMRAKSKFFSPKLMLPLITVSPRYDSLYHRTMENRMQRLLTI